MIGKEYFSLVFDECTDKQGNSVLAFVLVNYDGMVCLDVDEVPNHTAETVVDKIKHFSAILWDYLR